MTPRKLMALLLGFMLSMFSLPAAAAPLSIEDAPGTVALTPYLDLLEDTEARYGADDILTDAFNARFQPLGHGAANFGFSHSDWWVRFTVHNDGASVLDTVFKLDYPLLDYVDVWLTGSDGSVVNWNTGNRRAFDTRPIEHREFLFPLELRPGEQKTAYIRVRTNGPVNIGLKLVGERTLMHTVELEYMVFGAYFGGFILLALSIVLLYLFDRQVAFLYYLTYILSYSSYMLAFNGLAFQYLWPDQPEFGQISRPILLTLSIIFLLQFSRSLLGIPKSSRILYHCVSVLQAALIVILLAVPFVGYGLLVEPIAVLNLAAFTLVIAMGVVAHVRGELAARYYLMAWSVFVVGVIVYMLKVFGILPHNFITHYGFQLGSFFEFLFLSAALGVRLRELRRLSNNDALTGLSNRRAFDLALAEEFSFSGRPGAELSLLVIDVDHFKRFNDDHGHAAGDRVLKELAQVFRSQIRRPGMAYRYGGEEFAVLLPRAGLEAARILAERLRERVASDLSFDSITVSIGVVSKAQGQFTSAAEFFVAGDQALYNAKNTGRDRVVVHEQANRPKRRAADVADDGALVSGA